MFGVNHDNWITVDQEDLPELIIQPDLYYNLTQPQILLSYQNTIITNISLHEFMLPPYSKMLIQADLRHLNQLPLLNFQTLIVQLRIKIKKVQNNQQTQFYQSIELQAKQVNKYSIYVTQQTIVVLYFQILPTYGSYKYMFEQSISTVIVLQKYRIPEEKESFLIVVQSKNRINLPYNKPIIDPSYSGYYLEKIPASRTASRMTTIESATTYWSTLDKVALPYLPYFSNCNGESDRIYMSQMMENDEDCELVPLKDTDPIQQFKFGSLPKADSCKIQRQCIYDEIPGMQTQFPYWQTLTTDSVLFSVTRKKIPYSQYSIDKQFSDSELVKCKINSSRGTNETNQYPLRVLVNLEYYQETQQIKTMIKCNIEYSLYLDSSENFSYQLQIQTKPMNHTNIMLSFGFEWYVYMIIFVIIGAVSNFQNLVLWLFHSSVSKKSDKSFRIRIYLRVIWQIAKGTLLGLFLFIVLLFLVVIVMNGKLFEMLLYQSGDSSASVPKVFWDSINYYFINNYNSQYAGTIRSGRMGLSFVVIGSLIIFYTSKYFIGCQKTSKAFKNYDILGRRLNPQDYNRGKFIFGTFIFIAIQFFFIYFAYSKLYSTNIWTFIVLMKIIQMIMEEITKSIYDNILPCLPLKVITDITAYMNTLSANNFYDFLFSFLIDVGITMIQKAYISQLQNIVVEKIQQKIGEINKFYDNLINDNEGENQNLNGDTFDQEQAELEFDESNQVVVVNYQLKIKAQNQENQLFEAQNRQRYHDDLEIQLEDSQYILLIQSNLHEKLKDYRQIENKINQLQGNAENKILTKPKKQEFQNIITPKIKTEIQNSPQEPNQQEIQQASSVFQMLLDNIVLLFTFFLQPFVILVYWITYDESAILNKYGISSSVVILYMLSAVVIAFFTIVNIILIFHLLQSYLEIDFEVPIAQLLDRFKNRSIFWKSDDEDINRKLGETLRGADHYCLSWQFFFILTVYISSMIFIMLGVSILMNLAYNPFDDMTTYLILPFWILIVGFGIWAVKKIGFKLNIDGWADFQQNSNDNNINAIGDISLKQSTSSKKDAFTLLQKTNNEQNGFTNHNLLEKESLSDQQTTEKKPKILIKSTKKLIKAKKVEIDEDQEFNKQEEKYEEETIKIQLETICKKLEKLFESNKFCLDYFSSKINKEHIKNKIWPIIQNLEEELPELPEQETKIMIQLQCNQKNIPSHHSKVGAQIDHNNFQKDLNGKNYEPAIIDLISSWKSKVQNDFNIRKSVGKLSEQRISDCQFCFETWGLYYSQAHEKNSLMQRNSYNRNRKVKKEKYGLCLSCSKILAEKNMDQT